MFNHIFGHASLTVEKKREAQSLFQALADPRPFMEMGMDKMGSEGAGFPERLAAEQDIEKRFVPGRPAREMFAPGDLPYPPDRNPGNVLPGMVADDADPVAEANERPGLFVDPDMPAAFGEKRNRDRHQDPEFSLDQGFLSPLPKISAAPLSGYPPQKKSRRPESSGNGGFKNPKKGF
jgi:hypothetical protein